MVASVDVVVIGAGMAGLVVARELARASVPVSIFDARSQAGGRVRTELVEGWPRPVELGPEFVHGSPPALLKLIAESNAGLEPAEAGHFTKRGRDFETSDSVWPELSEALSAELSRPTDRTLADLLAATTLEPAAAEMLATFVEGFHAADLARVSARSVALQTSSVDEPQYRLARGYGHVRKFVEDDAVSRGARLVTETAVRRVEWRPGKAVVHGDRGQVVEARCVVVALPVSALNQPGAPFALRFEPDVSARAALQTIAMGHAFRVVFRLAEPIWDVSRLGEQAFLHARALDIPTFWTGLHGAPTVTAWCGGVRALRLLERGSVPQVALGALAGLFEKPVSELERRILGTHFHDFSHEPSIGGAYPYVLAGGDPSGAFEPEGQTIFFAGDYTEPTELGTVGATVGRAVQCAEAVLQRLRSSS